MRMVSIGSTNGKSFEGVQIKIRKNAVVENCTFHDCDIIPADKKDAETIVFRNNVVTRSDVFLPED